MTHTNPEQWAVELWRKACHDYGGMSIEGAWGEREAALAIQAAFAEREARNRRTMQDHGRMLWRDDVEGHCPTPNLCFEYSETARCGPCAIKQSNAAGVEVLNPDNSYSPEVCRLKREVAQQAEREARLVGAITSANAMACTPDGDGSHKITLHYPDTSTAMAAFVQLSDVADGAALKDRT